MADKDNQILFNVMESNRVSEAVMRLYGKFAPCCTPKSINAFKDKIENKEVDVVALIRNGIFLGFYILKRSSDISFMTLSVFGEEGELDDYAFSMLLEAAISKFEDCEDPLWLLVESTIDQMDRYRKFDFKEIMIDYSPPYLFGESNSKLIHLMVIQKKENISRCNLGKIVKEILTVNYGMEEEDRCVVEQISSIPVIPNIE